MVDTPAELKGIASYTPPEKLTPKQAGIELGEQGLGPLPGRIHFMDEEDEPAAGD